MKLSFLLMLSALFSYWRQLSNIVTCLYTGRERRLSGHSTKLHMPASRVTKNGGKYHCVEGVCVCVCVCVSERERERENVCVCVCDN